MNRRSRSSLHKPFRETIGLQVMDARRAEVPGVEDRCSNPWRGEEGCGRTDICVYIQRQGRKLPICHSCWDWILTHNKKW